MLIYLMYGYIWKEETLASSPSMCYINFNEREIVICKMKKPVTFKIIEAQLGDKQECLRFSSAKNIGNTF